MIFGMRMIRRSRPEVFCKKGVLRNFAKFKGKHLCQSLFFNKVADLHRCFTVNFAKFLRTSFYKEHLWWLLLDNFRLFLIYVLQVNKTLHRLHENPIELFEPLWACLFYFYPRYTDLRNSGYTRTLLWFIYFQNLKFQG